MRRSNSALAPDEQPNPTAKRKVKNMADDKVKVRMRMEGMSKSGMRYAARAKEADEICRSISIRSSAFEKLGKPEKIEVTVAAVRSEGKGGIRDVDGERQKRCGKCGEWKDEGRFYKRSKLINGLAGWCKECADKSTNKCRRRRVLRKEVNLEDENASRK